MRLGRPFFGCPNRHVSLSNMEFPQCLTRFPIEHGISAVFGTNDVIFCFFRNAKKNEVFQISLFSQRKESIRTRLGILTRRLCIYVYVYIYIYIYTHYLRDCLYLIRHIVVKNVFHITEDNATASIFACAKYEDIRRKKKWGN